MPVSTAAPGRPDDVHALAGWLRTTLGGRIGEAAGDLHTAVGTAETGWRSSGGEAFRARTTRSAQGTDELVVTTTEAARALDDLAVGLQRAQAEMREIRLVAQAEGLGVDGDDILDPGPAPVDPGPLTIGPATTQAEVDDHAAAVQARTRWNRAEAAYTRAGDAAEAVGRHWSQVTLTALRNARTDIQTKWILTAGDMVGAGAQGLVAAKVRALQLESTRLRGQAEQYRLRAMNAPAGTPREVIYRDWDDSRRIAQRADDFDVRSGTLDRAGAKWGLRAGGVLAVGGVAYDIANGKPVEQAIVSGAVGFGASVAAGAAIGTFLPVPVVGTVLGAAGGAVVGLFASGAVDSLYEHGIGDVSAAWDAGVDAVTATGATIGELGSEAWDAIF